MDSNGDGEVDIEEFVEWWNAKVSNARTTARTTAQQHARPTARTHTRQNAHTAARGTNAGLPSSLSHDLLPRDLPSLVASLLVTS